MLFQRLFGGSRFLKRMNTLMEVYACSHNAPVTYRELQRLKPLIRTEGEQGALRAEPSVASLRYEKIPGGGRCDCRDSVSESGIRRKNAPHLRP